MSIDNTRITSSFPSDEASNAVKKSDVWGIEVAEAITSQWFGGQLSTRRYWVDLMRSYSRGEQDVQQYKDTIEGTRKDKESKIGVKTHKIDYSPLKVLASFKDIVINPIDESLFKPRAEAIDLFSVNKKKDKFRQFEKNFFLKDFDNIVDRGLNTNNAPKNVPKDQNGLKIQKLEFKPEMEIAQELAIENVMKLEKFETIKDKVNEDIFDLGYGVGRHFTDFTEGIKPVYVDPYNFIHSPFEQDDARDLRYAGEPQETTIVDLEKQSGRKFTKEELQTLKNLSMGVADLIDDSNSYIENEDGDRLVESISFVYLTKQKRVYKKLRQNKSVKLIDRSDDETEYNPSNRNKKIEIPFKVWFEGIYVPTAQILCKWEKIKNQVEKGVNDPICPYIIYAPKVKRNSEKGFVRFDSMTQRAKPIIDDIHRDWFKFQQLKMELRPNTAVINPQALENVFLNGEKIGGQDILDMYFGRGILLANEVNEDGDPVGRAIIEQGGGVNNSGLAFLSNELANGLNRLRGLLGINEVRDGTNRPNSKTAVAVQKILLASSNNSTSHIVRASFNISLQFAEAISLRLVDVLKMPTLRNRYMSIIGSDNVEILSSAKNSQMRKFGIYFDFKPDDKERIAFEQSLLDAYSKGAIDVAQYNKARMVRNAKGAIKYLEFIIAENAVKEQRQKTEIIRQNAEANAQTAVVAENKKQQTLGIEWTIKKQEMLLESEIADKKAVKDALIENMLAGEQHARDIELKYMEVKSIESKEEAKAENQKDNINLQSSNTSKLVEQRQNNTPPVDFENDSEINTNLQNILSANKINLPNEDNPTQEQNI